MTVLLIVPLKLCDRFDFPRNCRQLGSIGCGGSLSDWLLPFAFSHRPCDQACHGR